MNPKRLAASVLAVIAGICSGISTISSWYTISVSGSGVSEALEFQPGDSLSASANGASASATYASQGLGQVGGLYEGVLVFGIVVMALSLIVGAVGLLWTFGKLRTNSKGRAFQSWASCLVVVALVAVLLVPLVQPALLRNDPGSVCPNQSQINTPCNAFWGSASSGGVSLTWGADAGWYLEIATVVLLVAAAVAWWLSRTEAWESQSELFGATAPAAGTTVPTGESDPSAPPNLEPSQSRYSSTAAPASPGRYCPSCGAGNQWTSQFCESCGRPLPRR